MSVLRIEHIRKYNIKDPRAISALVPAAGIRPNFDLIGKTSFSPSENALLENDLLES